MHKFLLDLAKFLCKILLEAIQKRKIRLSYLQKNIKRILKESEACGYDVSQYREQLEIAQLFVLKPPTDDQMTADIVFWRLLRAVPVKHKTIRNRLLNRLNKYEIQDTRNWRLFPPVDGVYNVQSPNVKEHIEFLISYFEGMKNLS